MDVLGESFKSLSFQFRMGERSLSNIIYETCNALFTNMKDQHIVYCIMSRRHFWNAVNATGFHLPVIFFRWAHSWHSAHTARLSPREAERIKHNRYFAHHLAWHFADEWCIFHIVLPRNLVTFSLKTAPSTTSVSDSLKRDTKLQFSGTYPVLPDRYTTRRILQSFIQQPRPRSSISCKKNNKKDELLNTHLVAWQQLLCWLTNFD